MRSSKAGSRHPTKFDPSTIPRYSVIRVPMSFGMRDKLMVIVAHNPEHGAAICMKATSQMDFYRNNPDTQPGVVLYPAGTVPFLPEDTVIQPDNMFAIEYGTIDNATRVLGALPEDFHGRLVQAVTASITLAEKRRRDILKCLCGPSSN